MPVRGRDRIGDGQRVGFAGSQLVWQYYAGQGIEIQWLGTFGKANGYFLSGRADDARLTALLDEWIPTSRVLERDEAQDVEHSAPIISSLQTYANARKRECFSPR